MAYDCGFCDISKPLSPFAGSGNEDWGTEDIQSERSSKHESDPVYRDKKTKWEKATGTEAPALCPAPSMPYLVYFQSLNLASVSDVRTTAEIYQGATSKDEIKEREGRQTNTAVVSHSISYSHL